MPFAKALFCAASLALLSASALATTTVYTTSASFLSNVAAGAYFNNFSGLTNPPAGPAPFSGGGFGYSAFAASDIYLSGGFLGTSLPNEALTITFTTGNVTAFGANFFATDVSDVFQPTLVSLTLSDGSLLSFTPGSVADGYRGFVSTASITSLVFSGPSAGLLYAGLDNFTVGVGAVPEPSSLVLMGLGIAGLFAARRRAA